MTAGLFYQAFAIYLSRRKVPARSIGQDSALRLAALLLYLGAGLAHATPWVIGQSGEVADAAGHVWRVQDLREAVVVTMLFTMFFTSMLATLRLATDITTHSRPPKACGARPHSSSICRLKIMAITERGD